MNYLQIIEHVVIDKFLPTVFLILFVLNIIATYLIK